MLAKKPVERRSFTGTSARWHCSVQVDVLGLVSSLCPLGSTFRIVEKDACVVSGQPGQSIDENDSIVVTLTFVHHPLQGGVAFELVPQLRLGDQAQRFESRQFLLEGLDLTVGDFRLVQSVLG